MKNIISFLVFFGVLSTWAQIPPELNYECSICSEPPPDESMLCNHTSLYWSDNTLYLPDISDNDIIVNINLIFLNQNNGIGGFQQDNPEHNEIIDEAINLLNYKYANLVNPINDPDCYVPSGFLSSSKIQFEYNKVYIDDSYFWNNDNDNFPFCPGSTWYMNALDNIIINDPAIPRGINIYFSESETYYNELIVNQTTQDPPPYSIACSEGPSTSNLDKSSRIHMPFAFSKMYWMKEYATQIYNQPWDPVVKNWFINSLGGTLAHELGHSFSLGHISDCIWSIMNPSGSGYHQEFYPNEIGKMHRYMAISNIRKFATDDSRFNNPKILTSSELWDLNFTVYSEIIVNPGVTLTVSCKLVMKNNNRIIVKPGGILIIDGGTITTEDDTFWKGIIVEGDANAHQYEYTGPCAQGKLILKNGAKIENALIGVLLGGVSEDGSYDDTKAGGIIQVIGNNSLTEPSASFINNQFSVKFLPYQNYYPTPNDKRANRSYFNNVLFENNDDYLSPYYWFYDFVEVYGVNGISFKGCTFTNQSSTPHGTGISCSKGGSPPIDAGISVSAICTSGMYPCPENTLDKCKFENLYKGIHVANTGIYTISVEDAIFESNNYGIEMTNTNNATILFNVFNIGQASSGDEEGCGSKSSGYGIFMDNCTGFAIEENYFSKYSGAPVGNYTGIHINNTEAADEVYNNIFEGISYANYAVGKNWSGINTWEGLAYYCNENTGNWQDITVADIPDQSDGIQNPIGSDELPAGNTFSDNANYNIYNDGDYWIGYYYYGNQTTPYYPDIVYRVTPSAVTNNQNECLSHYGGGGSGEDDRGLVLSPGEKLETEQAYAENLADYYNVKVLYDNLKDGGNTEATLEDVETSWPSDTWELRAELLGKSPHLSMDVLKAAADKTDVLPESIIFEIMAANPDELKKEELIKYLEDKENPLPEYMIDILEQVATGTTYKTVLQKEMAHYNRLKTRAAHDMIRSILNDTILNLIELRNWLDNLGGKRADEQIISSYIQEGNYTDAQALAGMMPGLYNYSDKELVEHNFYTELLDLGINLAQQGRSFFDLDSAEVDNLVYIANSSKGTGGAQARGILETAYGYDFCNCLNVSDSSGYKSSSSFNYGAFSKALGPEIDAKPNPASDWVAFNYILPDNTVEGIIEITDVYGKIIEAFTVNGMQGQKVWDTRKTDSGIYFYTFTVNGISKSGKLVITK